MAHAQVTCMLVGGRALLLGTCQVRETHIQLRDPDLDSEQFATRLHAI